MLDPLSALSLAAAVVQFVDFSSRLVAEGYELYEKGTLGGNDEIEQATRDLSHLAEKLTKIPQQATLHLSGDEVALQDLALSCKTLADQLLLSLESLKLRIPRNGLQSFRKALQNSKNKGKIQDVEKRLGKLRKQLNTRLIAILNDQQSNVISLLTKIADENRKNDASITHQIDELRTELLAAVRYSKQAKQSREIIKALSEVSNMCLQLSKEGCRVAATQRILKSLYFRYIRARQTIIKKAHAHTFEWIFYRNNARFKTQTRFLEWMQARNGIYWISGKAGSGKSTLMKYLWEHQRTQRCLEKWAGSAKLVTASYFFWSAGSKMQKSQEGLLQSLLYQVLKQCPDLIPTVCATRWEAEDSYHDEVDAWSIQELSDTIDELAKQKLQDIKFCFFVDGLDEYDGEHIDVIRILERFANSPSIKICASSRPWNVFTKAFSENTEQTLLLQDFTKADIERYVIDELEKDARFQKLIKVDSRYHQLVNEIVERAQGVFLWVFLVVRSLLRGLTDDNDMATLQRRLEHLPPDLERYFRQMLDTIEDIYQEQTAQLFQIAAHAIQPLSTVALGFLEQNRENIDSALHAEISPMSKEETLLVSTKMNTYINARCKDLLEVNCYSDSSDFFPYKVDFLHRTVRDFLKTKDMYNLLQSRTKNFDPTVSLCRILLSELKVIPKPSHFSGPGAIREMVWELLYYAFEVESKAKSADVAMIDEVERVLSTHMSSCEVGRKAISNSAKSRRKYNRRDFIVMAVEAQLIFYTREALFRQRPLLKTYRKPLLDYALQLPTQNQLDRPFQVSSINPEIVSLLLELGADPNEFVGLEGNKGSVWARYLQQCYKNPRGYYTQHGKEMCQVTELLLKHGADPEIIVEVEVNGGQVVKWWRVNNTIQNVGKTATVPEILTLTFSSSQSRPLLDYIGNSQRFWVWQWIPWK